MKNEISKPVKYREHGWTWDRQEDQDYIYYVGNKHNIRRKAVKFVCRFFVTIGVLAFAFAFFPDTVSVIIAILCCAWIAAAIT